MSTPKTIQLNISERLSALALLNAFKGALDKLAVILEDIKQIGITDEEWTKAERVITPSPTKEDPLNTTWSWDNEKGGLKDIVFQSATLDYLKETIKAKNDKGEFTLQDKAFVTMN